MFEERFFTVFLTVTSDSVNVGDMILSTDQRVAKWMEMRYDFDIV